jgi:hypothetical protein
MSGSRGDDRGCARRAIAVGLAPRPHYHQRFLSPDAHSSLSGSDAAVAIEGGRSECSWPTAGHWPHSRLMAKESELEMAFDVEPFGAEDAEDDGVAHSPIAPRGVMANHSVPLRAERLDRPL